MPGQPRVLGERLRHARIRRKAHPRAFLRDVGEEESQYEKQRNQRRQPAQRRAGEARAPAQRSQDRGSRKHCRQRDPHHPIVRKAGGDEQHRKQRCGNRQRSPSGAEPDRCRRKKRDEQRRDQDEIGRKRARAGVPARRVPSLGGGSEGGGERGQDEKAHQHDHDEASPCFAVGGRDIEGRHRQQSPRQLVAKFSERVRQVDRPQSRRQRAARPHQESHEYRDAGRGNGRAPPRPAQQQGCERERCAGSEGDRACRRRPARRQQRKICPGSDKQRVAKPSRQWINHRRTGRQ